MAMCKATCATALHARDYMLIIVPANALIKPDSLRPFDMLMRIANHIRVSQAGVYSRQSRHVSTPGGVSCYVML